MSGFFSVVGKVLFFKTGNFLGNISIIYMLITVRLGTIEKISAAEWKKYLHNILNELFIC